MSYTLDEELRLIRQLEAQAHVGLAAIHPTHLFSERELKIKAVIRAALEKYCAGLHDMVARKEGQP